MQDPIEAFQLADERADVVLLARHAPSLREPRPLLWVIDQVDDPVGQRLSIPFWYDPGVLAIGQPVQQAVRVRGDDGASGGERLEHGEGCALPERREHAD